MSQVFHNLTVKNKTQETPDTVSIEFDFPETLSNAFKFKSGQYLTIKRDINGEELRRSYSICSAPFENRLSIGVKKVKNGRVSTWLVDDLEVGSQIEIGAPEGQFTINFDPAKRRNFYFIAAGSGITPVMSLIKDGLESEPMSTFTLLYGSRNEKQIIFKEELDQLQSNYGEQLKIFHTLSQQGGIGSRINRLFGGKSENAFWSGRIDQKKLHDVLEQASTDRIENHFFLCGPGEMILKMEEILMAESIPGITIHKEFFTNPDQSPTEVKTDVEATLHFKNLHGEDGEVTVKKGKTLLEALMDKDKDPPYSCMNGVCSSCVAKLTKGEVSMDTCLALEDDEITAGYILTCQSHPVTSEIEVEYDS